MYKSNEQRQLVFNFDNEEGNKNIFKGTEPLTDSVLDVTKEKVSKKIDKILAEKLHGILYEHQKKVLPYEWKGNTLIIMPTGSGKTEVGFWAMLNYRENDKKAIFLTPTLPLTKQQYQRFKALFYKFGINLSDHEIDQYVSFITGLTSPEKRQYLYNANFIFATPQTLENDIERGYIKLNDISIVIFDECHNARKQENKEGHSYFKLGQLFARNGIKILGLMPARGKKAAFERLKEAFSIKIINEAGNEIKRRVIKVYFEFEPPIKKKIESLIKYYEKQLKKICDKNGLKFPKTKAERKKFYNALQGNYEGLKIYWIYDLLNDYLEKIMCYGLMAFINFKNKKELTQTGKMINKLLKKEIEEVEELIKNGDEHLKIRALPDYIKKGKSTLIFINFFEDAVLIYNYLLSLNDPLIRPGLIAGRSKMNENDRNEVIEKFKEQEINVLISTSVGEEGIDIKHVDNVIFFEPIPSAIRKIQRIGRARMDSSNVWVFITKNSSEELYMKIAERTERTF